MHHAHRIAAALLATVLSTAVAVAPLAAAAPAASAPALAGDAPTEVRTVLAADEAPADEAPADEAPADEAPADEAPTDEAPSDEAGEEVKYYVMKMKPNGQQEFLFEIAQRYLGDGNRYTEIFELNEGRVQPDGSKLTDPATVLPGWVMVMPEDAEGKGIQFGVLPTKVEGAGTGAGGAGGGALVPRPSVPYYVVGTTSNGGSEGLYDIAERFLGNGDRFMEIFKLNRGRVQLDGGRLTDPETVVVGWALRLPKDAEGPDLRHGPLPGRNQAAGPNAGAPGGLAPGAADPAASTSWLAPTLISVGAVVVLGALAFGGVLLVRRLRAGREEPFDDSLLRTDTSASWMVDRALRVLIASCERDGLDVPGLTGVFIEGGAMRIRLAGPVSPAPAPWVANEDGQSWSAPLARLQSAEATDGSTARFARLVTIGVAETGRVLVDFARARGIISLDGSTRARHEVLRRWLGELTGNPWSNDPRVVMVGNGLPQPEQVEHLAAIEQVIPELEAADGGILVLSQAPSAALQDMLAARFAAPGFSWIVVVLGQVQSAKWRITAGEDGWLSSGFLPDVRYAEQTPVRRGGE